MHHVKGLYASYKGLRKNDQQQRLPDLQSISGNKKSRAFALPYSYKYTVINEMLTGLPLP
jgi:hypothetical protein